MLHGNAFSAAAMLASAIPHTESSVAVPKATGSALAQMPDGTFIGAAARLLELAHTCAGCANISLAAAGSGAVTLFACAYPILAALIGAALRLLSCFILAMSSRTRQDARTRPCRIG